MKPLDKMTIIQHNVRGWKKNKFPLSNIYNKLDADVILLNELSLTDEDRLKIFNFNCHYVNKANQPFKGTAIAIRHNLEYRLLDDFETDLIGISVMTRQGPITIATLYSPPNAPYLNLIDFNSLFRRPEPVYFLGDLNARHRIFGHANINAVGRNVNTLIQTDLCRHEGPDFPTLLRHNATTSPDIVLTNHLAFHNFHLRPGPITPSDHIPIIATLTCNPIQIPIKPRKSIHRANWEQYATDLSNIHIPTDPHPTLEQIDDSLDQWTEAIKKASDDNLPTLKYRTIPGILPNDEIKQIQILYSTAVQHIATIGPSLALMRYIDDLKRQLRTEYLILSNETWNNIIDRLDLEDDPKKFWKTVKRLKGNDKQRIPYLRDHDNAKLHSATDKEILFRNHWSKIFSDDDDQDNDFDNDFTDVIKNDLDQNFDAIRTYDFSDLSRLGPGCPKITLNELDLTLSKFKQKAPGPTGITTEHLKRLPLNMTKFILYIFNHSLSTGYFPDKLKHAHMIFIPKGNTSQYNIANYRPISLIDIHSKLLDKILNTRLTLHLENNNITNIRQHGFRHHRGTHTGLAVFYETLVHTQALKQCTDVVLRDVAKAFDKVWHTGLKYKITQLHLHPCFTKILSDYLTDRTASIHLDNYTGPPFQLNSGVPQGACLSPTLYNYYTHDLPQPLPFTDYIAFADDITQITSGHYGYNFAARTTENAIIQINDYENKWKIKTNTSKFKIINISRINTHEIYINQNTYQYTNSGKILGLTFGSRGLTPHIKIRKAIAQDNLSKLNRFRTLSTTNKMKLYTSLVRSALIYPIIPLNTISKTNFLSLQRTQNKALRFITNTHWTEHRTSQSLHQLCNIEPINIVVHRQSQSLWNKIKTFTPQLYNQLLLPPDSITHRNFPSSRVVAERPPPDPIYR
jgi:hypothetical protein